jgi:hypothetical protein
VRRIGVAQGTALKLGAGAVEVASLKQANEAWLPALMAGEI